MNITAHIGLGVVATLGLAATAPSGTGCSEIPSERALQAHGPLESYGYPLWYEDQNGLRLMHCVDPDDPLCDTDPLPHAGPPSITEPAGDPNFWNEQVYYRLSASLEPAAAGGGTSRAEYTATVAGTWGGPSGQIIDGDQTVFSRISIKVDIENDPANSGVYRIIHPYGIHEFIVSDTAGTDGDGKLVINFTDDCLTSNPIGCGCDAKGICFNPFSTPIDPSIATINVFCTWPGGDGLAGGAPAGYIGDPRVPSPIEGSPCDQNILRIEGPNFGGPGVDFWETSLFSVTGKIHAAPATGACCAPDGSCSLIAEDACTEAGGTFQGNGTACAEVACTSPVGACCLVTGVCATITQLECTAQGGTWQGEGVSCDFVGCPLPDRACCLDDGSCELLTGPECAAAGGTHHPEAEACGAVECPIPPCDADVTGDGTVDVEDMVTLLLLWGDCGSSCTADVNGDQYHDVQDLTLMILHWGDCPGEG